MKTIILGAVVLILTAAALAAVPETRPRTFATPQDAAQALVDAAEKNDSAALLQLFGAQGKDVVESGDSAEDKNARAEFARRAHEEMQIEPEPGNPNRVTIVTGSQHWPLPIPLVRQDGQWHFDVAEGRMEILARRIGRHELTAIDVCRAYVEAQMEYAANDREGDGVLKYAQRIHSSPGKNDGLFRDGTPDNLVPKAFADAATAMFAEGKRPVPYHGYYFHILKAQGPDAPGGASDYVVNGKMFGGFAMVAYPAEYGVSGIKTFLVNHRGVVYEKDLGPPTATLARQMKAFNPDKTWKAVGGE